jgi:hypothetical protein
MPSVKNIVLVGDEDQLPPHGVDQVPSLSSLFDVAITHPSIPSAVLNITFRLPSPIALLLSERIYKGKLVCQRHSSSDKDFLKNQLTIYLRRPFFFLM